MNDRHSFLYKRPDIQREQQTRPRHIHVVFITGLKGQADKAQADTGKTYDNGIVNTGELKTYLTENIGKATGYKQTPTYSCLYEEDFPLIVLRPGITFTNEISKRPRKVVEKPIAANPSKVIEYITAKENKSLQNGIFSHAETFGRVTFINEMGFPLRLDLLWY